MLLCCDAVMDGDWPGYPTCIKCKVHKQRDSTLKIYRVFSVRTYYNVGRLFTYEQMGIQPSKYNTLFLYLEIDICSYGRKMSQEDFSS